MFFPLVAKALKYYGSFALPTDMGKINNHWNFSFQSSIIAESIPTYLKVSINNVLPSNFHVLALEEKIIYQLLTHKVMVLTQHLF